VKDACAVATLYTPEASCSQVFETSETSSRHIENYLGQKKKFLKKNSTCELMERTKTILYYCGGIVSVSLIR